jgi:hypothetical protein
MIVAVTLPGSAETSMQVLPFLGAERVRKGASWEWTFRGGLILLNFRAGSSGYDAGDAAVVDVKAIP